MYPLLTNQSNKITNSIEKTYKEIFISILTSVCDNGGALFIDHRVILRSWFSKSHKDTSLLPCTDANTWEDFSLGWINKERILAPNQKKKKGIIVFLLLGFKY